MCCNAMQLMQSVFRDFAGNPDVTALYFGIYQWARERERVPCIVFYPTPMLYAGPRGDCIHAQDHMLWQPA